MPDRSSSINLRPALAVLVCVGCLTLFVNKAFAIDDPLFLWAAQHIQHQPANPYGFDVNWYGQPMRMADVTKNPPLSCYALALAGALFGWNEIGLHLAFLLPAAGVAWGTYRLAEDLCGRPLLATLTAILTPVFLVSSTNVMCDTMMLCLWVWAIVCWRRGQARPGWLVVAGILISLCALTKYFGVSLIPLLLAHTLISRRRIAASLAALLIPVVVLGVYQELTRRMYGRGLLLDAAGFSVGARKDFGEGLLDPLIGLAFAGGCLTSVLFYLPLLWSRRVLLAGVVLTVVLLTPILVCRQLDSLWLSGAKGWDGALLFQFGVLFLGGLGVMALAVTDVWRHRDADAWLLFLWVAGTLVFALGVNWVINGRSLLPLAPATGILVARRLDVLRGSFTTSLAWREAWPLIPTAVVALLVTAADCRQADAERTAAYAIADRCAGQPGTLWFEGHWGFQYYLQQRGGVPVDLENPCFHEGDWIALPGGNYGVVFQATAETTREDLVFDQALFPFLSTMSEERSGFYSHVCGPLPFAFGPAAPLRYRVLLFLRPMDEP